MIDPKDIRPLTEFQRNAKATIARLKKSKRPVVLTVNGRASVVLMDAGTYMKMIEFIEDAELDAAIKDGLADVAAGRTRPLADVLRDLRTGRPLIGRRTTKRSA
jgi:PHD/YefM family antitoxin component YafN of YafNO toxin-antitoxin module